MNIANIIYRFISRCKYLWNKRTNQYYWFQVKYTYRKSIGSTPIFDWSQAIGVRELKTMYDLRALKKIPHPLHTDSSLRRYLCNGVMGVEIICYIGKYSIK